MSFKKEKIDKRGIINRVLLTAPKISEAPRSLSDFPGFWETPVEKLSDFEAAAEQREAVREYKSVDADGNIYLIKNPWHRGAKRPKPRLVMTYDQALLEATDTVAPTQTQQRGEEGLFE